ncbi:CocE/NonD family hydrolase [Pedobacter sp.]|jgi:putative CocE/NonD family hydrolase|uniref:CocE/NonD family hydrolase n=1 Tax=Pedobacter sp. TaxID=1411316 RepID=UPI002C04CF79|nr:CocE/NonD family hydrolase [Pedobacter sp.]HWW38323.1 CocE/NonD family hydrolase [Pedobacter sp.]
MARLKSLYFAVFLIFTATSLSAQQADSAYVRENYTKIERLIPMRDGVKLFTAIYIPKEKGRKFPFLINRTPYTVSPYGEDKYKTSLGPTSLFLKEGFIFVYQDVRGKWMSEGDYVDIRPQIANKKSKKDIDESSDTYDTIDWLLKNIPNNNGKAGIYGISYPGFYSTTSLPNAHPALKAVSPQAPVTDWFRGDDFHHNGVLFLADAFSFYSGFGVPRPKPITPDKGPKGFEFPIKDNYRFFLSIGALKNVKEKYFGDTIKFWNDLMAHGTYDSFWKERNILPHLTNVKPAVLVVGGFFDAEDAFGAIHTYEAIEKQNPSAKNNLVMGPWFHGGWVRSSGQSFGDISFGQPTSIWYQQNVEFPFFMQYLKDTAPAQLAEATIFVTGSNEWKKFNTWPPKDIENKTLYFQSNGKLSFTKPGTSNNFDEYESDPNTPVPYQAGIQEHRTREYMIDDQRFAARRPDVKVYQTDELQEDVTLAGPLTADLQVSTTGTDADYVVKLIDVYPENAENPSPNPKGLIMGGYQMLVRGEIMRGKFRNSFEKPEPFQPGKVTEVKYSLVDVAHTFKKGHRIMIQVQNSWFPIADRNPQKFLDIYTADDKDFQKATHRIYHDADHASGLNVTVLKP